MHVVACSTCVIQRAWVMLAVFVTAQCKDFSSGPGIQRADVGGEVNLTWYVDYPLSYETGAFMKYPGGDGVLYYVNSYFNDYGTGYSDSKVKFYYEIGGSVISIRLLNIQTTDAGDYECRHSPAGSSPEIINSDATLYVYGNPAKPQIPAPPGVKQGDDITLSCSSYSTSVPSGDRLPLRYTWTRDDVNLTVTPAARHRPNGNQLTISVVIKDEANHRYSCLAGEDGGPTAESNTVTLLVTYPPGAATATVSVIGPLIEADNPVTFLECKVNDKGNPPATFTWSKDGQNQAGGGDGVITIGSGTANVNDHDGEWTCTPTNAAGDGQSATITVTVNALAVVSPALPDLHTAVADPVDSFQVTCGFSSKPAAAIMWTYDGTNIPPGVKLEPKKMTLGGKKTTVTQKLIWNTDVSTRREAGGLYVCQGTVDLGTGSTDTESTQMTLLVQFTPHSIRLNGNDSQTAVAGLARVTRICSAICNPGCNYQWKDKDGRNMGRGDRLDLNPVEKNHHGTYTCWATNVHNTAGITKDFTLTVNYSPEVLAPFSSSISDPVETDSLTISCKISSRPDSTIKIQNTDNDTILIEASDQEVQYVYSSVQCLDTANYQCTANNTIGNVLNQTLFMNVKCPLTPVESRQKLGAAVGDNVTFSKLTTANPYPDITKTDLTFSPLNDTSGSRIVPDNVHVSVRDASHMVQKYVTLGVVKVTVINYGNYTLKPQSQMGPAAKVVFELDAQGPPGAPSAPSHSQDPTAVSLYLEWTAGFNGGQKQTFTVLYTNLDTNAELAELINTEQNYNLGDIVPYKLKNSDTILPATSYRIRIKTVNGIAETGEVIGESAVFHTKAVPGFPEGNPPPVVFDLATGVAVITLDIINPESVDRLQIMVCVAGTDNCNEQIITDLSVTKVTFPLPDATAKSFDLSVNMYDGEDTVYMRKWAAAVAGAGPPIAGIVGGIIATLLIAGLVIALVMLWRKGIIPKKQHEQEQSMINNNGNDGHVNSTMTEIDEITPYGTSDRFTTSNTAKTSATSTAANAPETSQVGPVNGDLYSVVKNDTEAPGPSSPSGAVYSQVNKPPRAPKPGEVKAGTSRPVSVFPPAHTPSSPPVEEMYAKVNKDKGKPVEPQPQQKKKGVMGLFKKDKQKGQNQKGPSSEGLQYENVELANRSKKGTRTQRATRKQETPYANVVNTRGQDGVYSEVQIPHMEGSTAGDNMYANTGDKPGPIPFMRVGKDGVLYAELDIINKPPAGHKPNQPDKIHGEENRTEYASINVDKLKKKK